MRTAVDRFPSDTHGRANRRCSVFLQIPKTGGRSLRSALAWTFPERQQIHLDGLYAQIPLEEEMETIPLERRSNARLVWGHRPYGAHRYIPRRCEYFTILREPIGRVVSMYKHVLRAHEHVLHDRVVGEGISLDQYIESGIDAGHTDNAQTRQLSGRQFGALDLDALGEAKDHLRECLVVGVTERFEETFALLRRTLRLRLPFYMTRNVSPPFQVSKRADELIRERNELDLELYGFARDIFAKELAGQSKPFRLEVSAYRALRPLSTALAGKPDRVVQKIRGRRGQEKSRR